MSLSAELTDKETIVERRADGFYPTQRLKMWWDAKTRGQVRRRPMMDVAVGTADGRPTTYIAGLYQAVYGRNVFRFDTVIFTPDGKGTPEFLLLANG